MNMQELESTVRDARNTVRDADEVVRRLASLAGERLQLAEVDHYTLVKLKRELAHYNVQTRCWKEKS